MNTVLVLLLLLLQRIESNRAVWSEYIRIMGMSQPVPQYRRGVEPDIIFCKGLVGNCANEWGKYRVIL